MPLTLRIPRRKKNNEYTATHRRCGENRFYGPDPPRRSRYRLQYLSRLGHALHPGMIWVSSGATEIGRLDYLRRHGHELKALWTM